jgi:hypothetical protein
LREACSSSTQNRRNAHRHHPSARFGRLSSGTSLQVMRTPDRIQQSATCPRNPTPRRAPSQTPNRNGDSPRHFCPEKPVTH